MRPKLSGPPAKGPKIDLVSASCIAAALVLAVLVLDAKEVILLVIGAAVLVLRLLKKKVMQNAVNDKLSPKVKVMPPMESRAPLRRRVYTPVSRDDKQEKPETFEKLEKQGSGPPVPKLAPSSKCWAPTFEKEGIDNQIKELLARIVPTPEDDRLVKKYSRLVRESIHKLIPEAEVTGFATENIVNSETSKSVPGVNGENVTCFKPFAMLVPSVDLVIHVSPSILMQRLSNRFSPSGLEAVRQDPRKLQKNTLRACTDLLVEGGGFKFKRSAYRQDEPKVTISTPGPQHQATPMHLAVNSVTPFHYAALISECGQIDPRAKELILIVRHWARDRGISHSPQGHFSPYTWSLLTIYYLQAGAKIPILPPFESFKSSTLISQSKEPKAWTPADSNQQTTGELLKDFVHFYNSEFKWQTEMASVRTGTRQGPCLSLPLHIIELEKGGGSEVGPSIENPFDVSKNMGDSMNMIGFARLKEELTRADAMLSQDGTSLTDFLEPWSPAGGSDHSETA